MTHRLSLSRLHPRVDRATALACAALAVLVGCAEDDYEEGYRRGSADIATFQAVVLPVLQRDCGFNECHGAQGRPFRIWGPGRVRLDSETGPYEDVTSAEQLQSHSRTVAMIDPDFPERSLLLRKPLAVEAGGASHGGVDDFGRDVYRSRDDEGYKVIARWAIGNQ